MNKEKLIDYTYWIKDHDISILDDVEECVDLYLKSINFSAQVETPSVGNKKDKKSNCPLSNPDCGIYDKGNAIYCKLYCSYYKG